jgi:hypothetical protein|tara:strand:+ start:69195 stop:69764 length:570 start_codon:yes stop_codon:yes gene_type:complete
MKGPLFLYFFLSIFIQNSMFGQENDGIMIKLGQYHPTGTIKETYNSGIGFEIGYCGIDEDFITEISIGYIKMTPINDIIYYQYTDDYGDVHNAVYEFDNYVLIPISFSGARKLKFSDKHSFFIGLGVGIINYKYSDTNNSEIGNTVALMPKTGFSFSITKALSLLLDIKYNYQPFESRSTWSTSIGVVF